MSSPLNDPFVGVDVPSPSESCLATLDEFDLNEASEHLDLSLESLEIIAQPCCSSRVRYRTDYRPPSKRRDPLTNKNSDSTYNGPAISIPRIYLNLAEEYYIGVSLATIIHEKTNCHYIHPYELESIDYEERNDRVNNIVWFPIVDEDRNGKKKSFPDIRIVRKTEEELESYGNLRPFHGSNSNLSNNVVPEALSQRQKVRKYNLKKAKLAFCIGQKNNANDIFPTIIDPNLIIFSDDMTMLSDEGTVEDDKSTESAAKSNPSPPPDCRMYKYAPRRGYTEGNQEILIFYTKKLEEKKYGKLQIIFQSDTSNINWPAEAANASNIEVKDQMVSFRTPSCPSSINAPIRVKIILQQRDRILEPLEYFYIQKSQCETCQANATNTSNPIVRMNSNKRTKSNQSPYDDYEPDGIVPVHESTPVLQQSKSVPESNSSNSTSRSSNQTTKDEDPLYPAVRNGIELLFTKNDYKPLLRSCRLFVRQRPELLHQAIDNNYSDLVSTFVPVAGIELLQHKNQFGETVLLHAARLNHVNTIKALLERKNSDEFLEDTNNKNQNIFHILALNTDSDSILDLFIEHLLKISINIHEKFDYIDIDNHTPLQLAIKNNNLSATRHLLKYFDKSVYGTSDDIGDTLIHIAVRYTDITMLKYLLNEGQLIQQGNQSNTSMKPIELARSMKHDDMVEYFKEIYPQPEIDEDENSDND